MFMFELCTIFYFNTRRPIYIGMVPYDYEYNLFNHHRQMVSYDPNRFTTVLQTLNQYMVDCAVSKVDKYRRVCN